MNIIQPDRNKSKQNIKLLIKNRIDRRNTPDRAPKQPFSGTPVYISSILNIWQIHFNYFSLPRKKVSSTYAKNETSTQHSCTFPMYPAGRIYGSGGGKRDRQWHRHFGG